MFHLGLISGAKRGPQNGFWRSNRDRKVHLVKCGSAPSNPGFGAEVTQSASFALAASWSKAAKGGQQRSHGSEIAGRETRKGQGAGAGKLQTIVTGRYRIKKANLDLDIACIHTTPLIWLLN